MNKLQKYLKHHHITQRGFAKRISITPANLNALLHGRANPSLRLAYIIEQETGGLVTVYDWVKDDYPTTNDKLVNPID